MRRVAEQMWRGGRTASVLAAVAALGLVGGCAATEPAPSTSADGQREVAPSATSSSVAGTVSAMREASEPEASEPKASEPEASRSEASEPEDLPSGAPSTVAPRAPETPSGSEGPATDGSTARESADDLPSSSSTTSGLQASESHGSVLSVPEQSDLAEASLRDAFEVGEGVLGAPLPAPVTDEEAAKEGFDDQDQRIDTEDFEDVAAGAYLAQLESQAQQYESEGLKQVGTPRILSVTPVTLPGVSSGTEGIVADVCVDSSQVQVLDTEGVDHRADQPSDPTLFRYTFALEGGSWRIVEETFPDQFTCRPPR